MIFNNDDFDLLYVDITSLSIFPELENPEITNLNNRLDQLTIDLNTQALQLQIEKVKRQKFHNKLKRVKKDLIPKNNEIHKTIHDLQSTVSQYHCRAEGHQTLFERELTHFRTITFRCLSQIHQVLVKSIPCIPLAAENHTDLSNITYELLRIISLLQNSVDTPVSLVMPN